MRRGSEGLASGGGEERNPPAWSVLSLLLLLRGLQQHLKHISARRCGGARAGLRCYHGGVVLTQRGGVLKDGGAMILAGVSSYRLGDTKVIPEQK